jgi:chromosomal replication initiation ATPase DnaA
VHSLQEHYKAVRARMGMGRRPGVVAIRLPAVHPADGPVELVCHPKTDTGIAADRDELQRLIDLRAGRHPAPPLSMKAIYLATAQHFEITFEEILGASRAKRCTAPRHIAFYLARELTGNPWGMVGQYARRDHSSIIQGWRKIDRLLRVGSKDVCLAVEAIKARLEP